MNIEQETTNVSHAFQHFFNIVSFALVVNVSNSKYNSEHVPITRITRGKGKGYVLPSCVKLAMQLKRREKCTEAGDIE